MRPATDPPSTPVEPQTWHSVSMEDWIAVITGSGGALAVAGLWIWTLNARLAGLERDARQRETDMRAALGQLGSAVADLSEALGSALGDTNDGKP